MLFADWTNNKKLEMSERLAEIAKTRFKSKDYEKMNEDTLSWWQNKGEEADTIDLYSDAEEDDEEECIDLSSDEEEEDSDDDS